MLETANFDPFLRAVLEEELPMSSMDLSLRDKTTLWVLLYRMLGKLTDEERQVVMKFYGLYGNQFYSESDIAKALQLMTVDVKLVRQQAMNKLRSDFQEILMIHELLFAFPHSHE